MYGEERGLMNNNEEGMRKEILWVFKKLWKSQINYGSLKKSLGFLWDCWMSMLCVFLTKKSCKIHSIRESINIHILLNTKRHFIS